VTGSFVHITADFVGVPAAQLTDPAMIGGLLIAAASAAGFNAIGSPLARATPHDGVRAVLLLDDCHMTAHTFPARELVLLDILTLAAHDARKAVDVFGRRLGARTIHTGRHERG
jgi:S-adenosylmethionine/arginine decarboxylase-like enzyme